MKKKERMTKKQKLHYSLFKDKTTLSKKGSKIIKWKLLIVDDDREGIHSLTRSILEDIQFNNQFIQIISTFSVKEAKEVLFKMNDIAVILLDLVMEHENAGFDLVSFVRKEKLYDDKKVFIEKGLGNKQIQIILRTGYPKDDIKNSIEKYGINSYLTKQGVTDTILINTVKKSLKDFNKIGKEKTHEK